MSTEPFEPVTVVVTLTVSTKIRDLFDEIKRLSGFTEQEIGDNLVMLAVWAVRNAKNGETIAAINEVNQTYREFLLPLIEKIREKFPAKS